MTQIIERLIKTPAGTLKMQFQYFDQLLRSNAENGRLTREFECHALWHYYVLACASYDAAKKNFVEESDLSRVFNDETAKNIFLGVANNYGVKPADMVKFWPIIHQQRIALGGDDNLPRRFQFEYWGH